MDATSSPRPYQRRKVLVNRPLQLAFVKAMLLVLLTMALAALMAVQAAVRITLSTYELTTNALAIGLLNTVFWVMVLELLVLTPVFAWMGILLTHKVAGPLVRIRAALAQLTEGRYDLHISLRKGDSLVGIADDINRLAASLRNRIR